MTWVSYLTVLGGVVLAGVTAFNAPANQTEAYVGSDGPDTVEVARTEALLAELEADERAREARLANPGLKRRSPIAADYGSRRWNQLRSASTADAGQRTRTKQTKRTASRSSSTKRASATTNTPRGIFARSRYAKSKGADGHAIRHNRTLRSNYSPTARPARPYIHRSSYKSIFERSRKYREGGSKYPMTTTNRLLNR